MELLFAMTSKSKIGYYFRQSANPGKGVPRENNMNENSKSLSTATESDSPMNDYGNSCFNVFRFGTE